MHNSDKSQNKSDSSVELKQIERMLYLNWETGKIVVIQKDFGRNLLHHYLKWIEKDLGNSRAGGEGEGEIPTNISERVITMLKFKVSFVLMGNFSYFQCLVGSEILVKPKIFSAGQKTSFKLHKMAFFLYFPKTIFEFKFFFFTRFFLRFIFRRHATRFCLTCHCHSTTVDGFELNAEKCFQLKSFSKNKLSLTKIKRRNKSKQIGPIFP